MTVTTGSSASPVATPANEDTLALDRVAVVVVSFNSAQYLPGLIATLAEGLAGVSWELVVADNDSSDDSVELVRRAAPRATVVEMARNAGYAAGVNAGVAAAAPHNAVLVLNADVRLDAGCVMRLLGALRQPGTGIAVPRLRDRAGRLIASQRREPTIRRMVAAAFLGAERAGRRGAWGEVVTNEAAYDRDAVTDWAEGSTQLIHSECWTSVGPWDESYFLYSEETDFGLRARDAGFVTRYVADAGAVHLEGGSAGSVRLWPLVVANTVRLYRSRHGRLTTAGYWAACLLREGSRALLGRPAARAAVATLVSPRRLGAPRGPEWLR
ncbi:glycosyltransferase family 2 protein [Nocardioides dilutus]